MNGVQSKYYLVITQHIACHTVTLSVSYYYKYYFFSKILFYKWKPKFSGKVIVLVSVMYTAILTLHFILYGNS